MKVLFAMLALVATIAVAACGPSGSASGETSLAPITSESPATSSESPATSPEASPSAS